jgi:hypothetical protein
MIKNRRNNKSKAKVVNVINQRREKTRGKNVRGTNTKHESGQEQ